MRSVFYLIVTIYPWKEAAHSFRMKVQVFADFIFLLNYSSW